MRPGRIRDRRTFADLGRHGRRARRGALTLILLAEPGAVECRVAFAIGRSVGSAVTRNRVRRRLRALLQARAGSLPGGALLIRVGPEAATQTSAQLGRSLDGALSALCSGPGQRP